MPRSHAAPSWFGSTLGRRYGRHVAALIALKIVLLTLLYWLCVAPLLTSKPTSELTYDAVLGVHARSSAPAGQSGDRSHASPNETTP